MLLVISVTVINNTEHENRSTRKCLEMLYEGQKQRTDLSVKVVPLLPVLLWIFVEVARVANVSNSRYYRRLQQ